MVAMAFAASPAALVTASSSPRLLSKRSFFVSSESPFLVAVPRTRVLQRRLRPGRSGGLGCRCLFGLGVPELVVIAGVAALVFGPKNLPEIGRSIGKTVKSFQQAAKEFETELKKDPEDSSESPPAESPKAVSSEDEKKELETSGTTDSS
ncbi:sec-independent protein translocase protein [Musa troglodytarum]|uniref:Sec-independent protein translocase protein n=1 Tax=Musa troglodytarum TaxID=320322 RepID=A0A9E7JP24_9LILI|nr:sec-independent protein translocase protein [Musa troglodytarum]